MPSSNKSIFSASGNPHLGGSQDHAALERYVQEKDRYKEFLVNGPKKNPFVSQPLNHFPPNSKQASGANKRGNSQGGENPKM